VSFENGAEIREFHSRSIFLYENIVKRDSSDFYFLISPQASICFP
jgi:hypothetical protein